MFILPLWLCFYLFIFSIVFVFGNEPYLRRDLAVDVKTVEKDSAEDSEKLQELQV